MACSSDDEVKLSSLEVNVSISKDFASMVSSLEGIEVTLVNTTDNVKKTANTDATGKTIFENIPSGTYNVSVSHKVAAALTLNDSKTDVSLLPDQMRTISLALSGTPTKNDFIIKEIYSFGAKDYNVGLKCQFMEIYNNTDQVLYADGLYFAELAGSTGSSQNDKILGLSIGEYVYATDVAQIPGTGTEYPVQPGKGMVIALNAMNFKEFYVEGNKQGYTEADYIDLSNADFEIFSEKFFEEKGFTSNTYFDFNNPQVKDVNIIYMSSIMNYGWFKFNSYGSGMVLFRSSTSLDLDNIVSDPESTSTTPPKYLKIKSDLVIDGMDILYNSESAKFKRIPKYIDAGFTYIKEDGKPSYSGLSIHRKVEKIENERNILMDTNNSSNDCEAGVPTLGAFLN